MIAQSEICRQWLEVSKKQVKAAGGGCGSFFGGDSWGAEWIIPPPAPTFCLDFMTCTQQHNIFMFHIIYIHVSSISAAVSTLKHLSVSHILWSPNLTVCHFCPVTKQICHFCSDYTQLVLKCPDGTLLWLYIVSVLYKTTRLCYP